MEILVLLLHKYWIQFQFWEICACINSIIVLFGISAAFEDVLACAVAWIKTIRISIYAFMTMLMVKQQL